MLNTGCNREERNMAKYALQPGEIVLLKTNNVQHGFWGLYTNELILTNQNFVWRNTGVYGFSKKIYSYSLNQIRVFDGNAQAAIWTHSGNNTPMLDIYFSDGSVEQFGFQLSEKESKKEIVKWIKAINKAVTGNDIYLDIEDEVNKTTVDRLTDAVGTVRGIFGIGGTGKVHATSVNTAKKCLLCGAPISGKTGQVVKCPYCGSDQQL
jgi:hypothetical protein